MSFYERQACQMEEHMTHFFPWVQTGGLSDTFLLKFLTSKIDSLMCHCCWPERALGKWSNSTIDFNVDFWHARNIWSDYIWHVRMWVYITISVHMAQHPEKVEVIWLQIRRNWYESFTCLMILPVSTKRMSQIFHISNIRLFQFCGLPIISMWRGEGNGKGYRIGITLGQWYKKYE